MSALRELALWVAFLVLCFLIGLAGCATTPRNATLVLACKGRDCGVVGPPEFHINPDDTNACAGPHSRLFCTEL